MQTISEPESIIINREKKYIIKKLLYKKLRSELEKKDY